MGGFNLVLSFIVSALTDQLGYEIAVWFLAGIFVWSGIVKLRRPVLAAMAMVDFGIVRHARPAFGLALGALETFLALALVLRVFTHLILPFTALLFWFFAFLIVRSLLSGERFACFCFGDSDSQISGWTLARTASLALLSTLLSLETTPTVIRTGFNERDILQALAALSLLGTIALTGYVSRLLEWNSDLLSFGQHQHTSRVNDRWMD